MHKQSDSAKESCDALIQVTRDALGDESLKALLSVVWHKNLDQQVYWLIRT
jgi:hypothetical protein